MKNIFIIIILALLPNQLLAAGCGEGDISIDITKFAPNEKLAKNIVRFVDASTLQVKEHVGPTAPLVDMELDGIVSRKAVCVGEIYCFVLRRVEDAEDGKKKLRWEPIKKVDPMAKGGTQSRVYTKSVFPPSTPSNMNLSMKIQESPRLVARRDAKVGSMEFEYQSEARSVSFTVEMREAEIVVKGSGTSVNLNLLTRSQTNQLGLDPAQSIVFKLGEQMDYNDQVFRATDGITKVVDKKQVKLKPIEPTQFNCLREAAPAAALDVKRVVAPAGSASAPKR